MSYFLFIKNKSRSYKRLGLLILLLMFTAAMNAQITVTGKVSDANGPIPGANVVLKGTSNGTNTNFDGDYSIANVPSNGVLVVSYIGYTSQEVAINGKTQINFTLENSTNTLDEVVIVGYGSMSRSNVTGAISSISTEELQRSPVPNVVEALRGQVAGLRITRGNGQPGSGVSFTVRGTNSLGEGSGSMGEANQPIIVVDGVPLSGGNLSELNSDDIESVNILKDAAAASIYGSSGSNGVILITTKSGKSGRPTITVKASTSINEVGHRVNIMNADQYVKYLFDAEISNGNLNPTIDGLVDLNERNNYVAGKSVNWQNEMLKQGVVNNVSLGVSGGTDQIRFYMNGDMYSEEGIVQSSDYKRYSFRFNGDYTPNDWLKVGVRVQLTKSFADETSNVVSEFNVNGGFAPFIPIFNNTPLGDLYDANGEYTKYVRANQFQVNPFHRYKESIIDRNVTRAYVNPFVDINIMDGLVYTLNSYAEDRSQFYGRFQSSNYVDGDPSEAQIQKQKSVNYLVDNIINYNKDFGVHSINATFVYGFQKNEFEQIDAFADKLPTDLLGYHAVGDVPSIDQRYGWETDESGKVYLVGRVGYGYDQKYIANFTVRRDGTSRTGENYRYGTFPSVSLAWNAHNEDFLGNIDFVSLMKLRLSYGELGNDRISTYGYLANSRVVQTIVGIDPDTGEQILFTGYAKNTPPNPDLKWETSKQFNIGLDYGFLNSRINGSIDFYNTKTTDLLLTELLPITSGYERITSNVGETENWGVDIALKGSIMNTEDFRWNATLNWAMDRNSIVRLNRASVNEAGEPIDDLANGWFIGEDIREIFNYKYTGVWQLDEVTEAAGYGKVPGDAKFLDINKDGAINADDRTFLGNPTPDWYGGISNTFNYKGIELSVLIEAVQGVTRVNGFYGGYAGRDNSIAIDYWTPNNPTNAFPRVGTGEMSGDFGDAIKTQDASFIALRNISLGYSIPQKYLDKLNLKGLSFNIRGNNLKYFTDFKDAYSPEAGIGAYPITRTWTFGTSVSF